MKAKIVYAIVAGAGVVLAAVYMIRLYQRSMHNPLAPGAESREMSVADGLVLVPVVAVILCARRCTRSSCCTAPSSAVRAPSARASTRLVDPMIAALNAPHIDYAGLSPLLALTGGVCVTLLLGLARGPGTRAAR